MRKVLLVLTFLLMLSVNVYAGGGNGESVPTLTNSIPADGDTDVALDKEITLVFSNNITNESVRENNINSIKLVDGDGNQVDIEVVLADDQVEPDKKRDAVIVPTNPLEPATNYSVIISPELTSKNGVKSGEEITVSFTTQAEGAVVTTTEEDTTQVTNTDETVSDKTVETPETTSTETETNNSDIYTYVIIVGAVIVLALVFIPVIKKKK